MTNIAKPTTRTYPHSTREFTIPGLDSDCKMVSAIYNGELHVLGGDQRPVDYRGSYLKHVKFPLSKLVTKGQTDWNDKKICEAKNWETVPMPQNIFASSPYKPRREESTFSDNKTLAVNSTALWMFRVWSDGGDTLLYATKYVAENSGETESEKASKGTWGTDIHLFDPQKAPDGKPAPGTEIRKVGAVSAVPFGDTQILVTCCSMDGGEYGSASNHILLYLFDVNDIDKDGTWIAKSKKEIDVQTEIDFYIGNDKKDTTGINVGVRIDTDWIYTLKPNLDPLAKEKSTLPQFYLAVLITPSIIRPESYSFAGFIPLNLEDPNDNNSELAEDTWGKGRLDFFNQGDGKESCVKRDPSGRLQRFMRFSDDKTSFGALYFGTAKPPTKANGFGNQGTPSSYTTYAVTDTHTRPTNQFYVFPEGKKATTTTATDRNGKKITLKPGHINPDKDPAEYPVLEFLFYGKNKCQLHDYGRIVTSQDTQYLKQKKGQEKVIIGGYFDSGIPFPVQNFTGLKLSNNEYEVGELTYSLENEDEKEAGQESAWSVGMEAEFHTTKGLGAALKASMDFGMGTETRQSYVSNITRKLPVPATAKSKDETSKPYVEEGSGMISLLKAQFNIMGYQFYDASGKIVNDGLSHDSSQSLKMGAVLTRMVDADHSTMSFEPFTIDVNDLESYTPEKINSRMKALGYTGDKDTSPDNYFEYIIIPNSLPLSQEQLPYLAFSWDQGKRNVIEVNTTASSFTEQSWEFDASLYAGISGGEEVSIFGLGDGFEASLLIGGSYSKKHSASVKKTSGWGIEISEHWGPINPTDPETIKNAVKSYSFRVYFLPVPQKPSKLKPNHWTKEFVDFLQENKANTITKEMVDTSSGSWRIAFVVDEICYYNEASTDESSETEPTKQDYKYSGDEGIRSVYL